MKNKKYYIDHYISKYLNIIECNDLDVNIYKEDIVNIVNDYADRFGNWNDAEAFYDSLTSAIGRYFKRNNIKMYTTGDVFFKAQKDKKYHKNLCVFYINNLMIRMLHDLDEINEEDIENFKKDLLEKAIKVDISNMTYYDGFTKFLNYAKQTLLIKHNIKKRNESENNIVIKAKNGEDVDINKLIKSFEKRFIGKYSSLDISKDKLEIYIKKVIEKSVKDYLKGNYKVTLSNYMHAKISSNINMLNTSRGLVRYARLTNDLDYTIDKIFSLYPELIKKSEDENILKNAIRRYIENNLEGSMKGYLSEVLKNERIKFDIDLARNGSIEERKKQRDILIENEYHLLELQSSKYKYYEEENKVNIKLAEIFYSGIDSYINGKSNLPVSRYISTVLNERYRNYSNSTYNDNYLMLVLLASIEYALALDNYYENHELSYTEEGNLEEYLEFTIEEYLNGGSYKQDIKTFIDNQIKRYEEFKKIS